MKKRGSLVLEDGDVFDGKLFGSEPLYPERIRKRLNASALENSEHNGEGLFASPLGTGEIVFNTAMSGYHEILTDPSYTGQIVTMTYPHIGNYGCLEEWAERGPETGAERKQIKASGLVVRSVYRGPIHQNRESISQFLSSQDIPGLTEVDTRRLTLRIRDKGAPRGIIVGVPEERNELKNEEIEICREFLKMVPEMEGRNLLSYVGTNKNIEYGDTGSKVAVLDCGIKRTILEELRKRKVKVTLFPSDAKPEDVLAIKPKGLLVSNGPGDPGVLSEQIHLLTSLIGAIPITGICLGHQLLCLALGANTYKMKFGHHGANHPVRDITSGKVFVTSQNHGFAVDEKSLPKEVKVWCKNANDNTLEGVISEAKMIQSVQFHPEAAPGPRDSLWIFDSFLRMMGISDTNRRQAHA
jgi:carbamoyl-phosphate synthase small subunit